MNTDNTAKDIIDKILNGNKDQGYYGPSILNAAQGQMGQAQPQSLPEDHPAHPVNQAATAAVQAGADPKIIAAARQKLGSQDFIGLCERFVEQVTKGATGLFASAKDAFNQQSNQAQTDFSKIKPGDAIYFGADQSNGGYGHTGVYSGNGKFISATDNGVQEYDLGQWQKMTGQKPVGFIPGGKG